MKKSGPERNDEVQSNRDRIIGLHDALIDDYARHRGLPRGHFAMRELEAVLVILIEKGLDGLKAVAVAGVAAEITGYAFALMLRSQGCSSQAVFDELLERYQPQAVHHPAAWLQFHLSQRKRVCLFWRKLVPAAGIEVYEQELLELYNQYFPCKKEAEA